jgi:predicted DNA-binding transcriptional regulator AlpA
MATKKLDEELLTPHELAKLVGYSPRSLEQWRRSGRGPQFIRVSGHQGVRYSTSAVRRWLDEHMTAHVDS